MIDFKTLKVGDYVYVEFGGNGHLSGSRIRGKITKLWLGEDRGIFQGQVDNGWCFHPTDRLLEHKPEGTTQ